MSAARKNGMGDVDPALERAQHGASRFAGSDDTNRLCEGMRLECRNQKRTWLDGGESRVSEGAKFRVKVAQ